MGVALSGTLYLPNASGEYPVVVWHFGSKKWRKSRYDNSTLPLWLNAGIAVLSYDKRGVGDSEGECCVTQDLTYFTQLADDIVAGILLVSQHPEIDTRKMGVFGFGEGGWVAPLAVSRSSKLLAFSVIGSGPTVTLGERRLYSQLTGADECRISMRPDAEIDQLLKEAGPSLFDPLPFLKLNEQPGLWLFAQNDRTVPVNQSVTILDNLINQFQKPYEYTIVPDANHFWIVNGDVCQDTGISADVFPKYS